jgi:hypothetical protein
VSENGHIGAGRPSLFTAEIGEQICSGLIDGRSLISICDSDLMPTKTTVYNWLLKASYADCPPELKEFLDQYTRARVQQAEALFDECLDIADDGRNDWMTVRRGKEEFEVPDKEVLLRSKLRVDTRITMAERLNPKKYRPSSAIDHTIATPPTILDDIPTGETPCQKSD